jgi:hypothetical protein
MPGARCARSRVCSVESTRVSHHGHTGNTRHSPRNGFNGFLRALPGVRILGCHRHQRIKVCQTRSGRLASANLAPATGARTTRLRRPQHAPFVCARFVRSRGSTRPAIPARDRRCRVHRIPPRVRDDRASAPLWDGTVSDILLIWGCGEAEYFCNRGWTGFSDLPVRHSCSSRAPEVFGQRAIG